MEKYKDYLWAEDVEIRSLARKVAVNKYLNGDVFLSEETVAKLIVENSECLGTLQSFAAELSQKPFDGFLIGRFVSLTKMLQTQAEFVEELPFLWMQLMHVVEDNDKALNQEIVQLIEEAKLSVLLKVVCALKCAVRSNRLQAMLCIWLQSVDSRHWIILLQMLKAETRSLQGAYLLKDAKIPTTTQACALLYDIAVEKEDKSVFAKFLECLQQVDCSSKRFAFYPSEILRKETFVQKYPDMVLDFCNMLFAKGYLTNKDFNDSFVCYCNELFDDKNLGKRRWVSLANALYVGMRKASANDRDAALKIVLGLAGKYPTREAFCTSFSELDNEVVAEFLVTVYYQKLDKEGAIDLPEILAVAYVRDKHVFLQEKVDDLIEEAVAKAYAWGVNLGPNWAYHTLGLLKSQELKQIDADVLRKICNRAFMVRLYSALGSQVLQAELMDTVMSLKLDKSVFAEQQYAEISAYKERIKVLNILRSELRS